MAFFCIRTGVRISGFGIVESYELTEADANDSAMKDVARFPEVVEVDGVEVLLADLDKPKMKASAKGGGAKSDDGKTGDGKTQ